MCQARLVPQVMSPFKDLEFQDRGSAPAKGSRPSGIAGRTGHGWQPTRYRSRVC